MVKTMISGVDFPTNTNPLSITRRIREASRGGRVRGVLGSFPARRRETSGGKWVRHHDGVIMGLSGLILKPLMGFVIMLMD